MPGPHTVIVANYHRIGAIDPDNPLHRLHTVATDVFRAQVDHMQQHGKIVSLDDVRCCRDLADVNFVISFDDVPTAAMDGIELLLDRQMPVTVSVCTQLAATGWGMRDKVYCIDKYADPDEVARAVRTALPGSLPGLHPVSFYHVTKRDDIDPDLVASKLIEPLFAHVEQRALPYLDGSAYLSWDTIRDLASDPLVTLANHAASHANLAALPPDRLAHDIESAHEQLAEHMGRPPRYLTVPFGCYHQRLAIDCVQILYRLRYHGILWVGDAANLVRAPYEHQLLQLTRLHTPTTLDEFIASLDRLMHYRLESAVWQQPPRVHREPVTIVESSDTQRSAMHEMVVRQGKDYASSPGFYRYQFTTNPTRDNRPDFYAVEHQGRIEATAYNFHAMFRFGDVAVPGVYLASWRKLPESHCTAAGTLVHTMTRREPIVGVYHPSHKAAAAFAKWRRVPVWRLTIPVGEASSVARLDRAVELDHFDDAIMPLVTAMMSDAGFTLGRDRAFYEWRHESYPLATCRYVLLRWRAEPIAYAVTLQRGDRLQIADWYAPSTVVYSQLVIAVQDTARSYSARTIELETSSHPLAADLVAGFAATSTQAANFYHLNLARLTELGVTNAAAQWAHFRFHETATTGDLLIR